jgi:hypothetical protein
MQRLAGILTLCANGISVEDLQNAELLHVLPVLYFHVAQTFQVNAMTSADDHAIGSNAALGRLTFPLTCRHLLAKIQDLF